MRCSRCAREIPDGSRFCGLCGGKQADEKGETLGGVAARARSATLVGGVIPAEVIAGGRRFAALSAATGLRPSKAPSPAKDPLTETVSEGVPAGAMAALLAARRSEAPSPADPPPAAQTQPIIPPHEAKTLAGGPKALRRQASTLQRAAAATHPDRPALRASSPAMVADATAPHGAIDDTAQSMPARADALDETAQSLPPASADLLDDARTVTEAVAADVLDETAQSLPPASADLLDDAPAVTEPAPAEPDLPEPDLAEDEAETLPRRKRVRPVMAPMPSVIVDSEFGREAQAAVESGSPSSLAEPYVDASELLAKPKPAADDSESEAASSEGAGGFRETAWFLDALDADALSRGETDDIQARQAQLEAGVDRADRLDDRTRRQYSLRSNDSVPAFDAAATELDVGAPGDAPRSSPMIGLIIILVVVLGVAGWFLFAR